MNCIYKLIMGTKVVSEEVLDADQLELRCGRKSGKCAQALQVYRARSPREGVMKHVAVNHVRKKKALLIEKICSYGRQALSWSEEQSKQLQTSLLFIIMFDSSGPCPNSCFH